MKKYFENGVVGENFKCEILLVLILSFYILYFLPKVIHL
jgi:hypothetical protein